MPSLQSCTSGNGQIKVCCSTSGGVGAGAAPLPIATGGNFNQNSNQGAGNLPNRNNNNFASSNQQFAQQQSGPNPLSNDPNYFECPRPSILPPVEQCRGQESNCWSVGLFDVDCPNNAPCCFDGCRNACYFGRELISFV